MSPKQMGPVYQPPSLSFILKVPVNAAASWGLSLALHSDDILIPWIC